MYKKIICSVTIVLFMTAARGQLSVSLHEPPPGIVQKSQLWSITLINSGNAPLQVSIALTLLDAADNETVMTAFTQPITLEKGVRQLKASDLGLIDYTYLSAAFDNSLFPDAFLPIGNYRACYSFYSQDHEQHTILAEDCISLEIAPLSPPQLNLPADSGLVETPYPQFSWLPPTPAPLFSNLNYDLLVTEVQAGQTPEEALQENLPVYNVAHLPVVAHNYPASYKGLDTGKVYAWRIVAKDGESFAAQSDVWTFRIHQKQNAPPASIAGAYLELKSESGLPSTGMISGDELRVKYYSYDKTHDAVIQFLNEKGAVVKQYNRTIQYGNNFLVFPLDHSFREETTYYVELTDLQRVHYKTGFRITK